jgi:hypothetical protein
LLPLVSNATRFEGGTEQTRDLFAIKRLSIIWIAFSEYRRL